MSTKRSFRIVRQSANALGRHRVRNGLAVLGMVIGVAAVVIMVSIGRGVHNRVLNDIDRLGTDLFIVDAGAARFRGARPRPARRVQTLKVDDARALERSLPAVLKAVPLESRNTQVKPLRTSAVLRQGGSPFSEAMTTTTIIGTTADFSSVLDYGIDLGRTFSHDEVKRLKRVAVVGSTLNKNLFGDDFPVDRRVLVGKTPFTIVGMYKSKGLDAFGEDQDDQMLVPITTMIRRVLHQEHVSTLILQVAPGNLGADLKNDIRTLLRQRHRLRNSSQPDDFTIKTQEDLLAAKKKSSGILATLVTSVAAISMVVAGVGILAVMLISIQERTKEIGLRRALGATRHDLLRQILLEALLLGGVGGAVGSLLGLVGSLIIRMATSLQFALPWITAFMAALIAILVSLIFAVMPARRAANLDPAVALATE